MKIYLFISIIIYTFAKGIGGGHVPLTRELPTSPFPFSQVGFIKKLDNMTRKKPLPQLLEEFEAVHHGRYDYSLVCDTMYKNNTSTFQVICKTHGAFPIRVLNHLQGQGCPKCASILRRVSNTGNVRKRTKLVYGVGTNDYFGNIKCANKHIQSYRTWVQMLKRCYSQEFLATHTSYIGCSVCEEWKLFSNFKIWFDSNYVDGYSLDKDILTKGNKIYSPYTCCFVPNEINVLLCKSDNARGNMPIGVSQRKMVNGHKYVAYLNNQIKKHFHIGTFNSPQEAFEAYKQAKEAHIKEVAQEYYSQGKITEKVYNALMNYKVEITD